MNQEQPSSHDTGPRDPLSVHMVLVHRNRGATGRRTIQRFLDQAATAHLDIAMTVVDNGSDPDQLTLLRDDLPDEVTIVEAGRNLGFGPGANLGLAHWLASDSSICLLAPHDARPACGTVGLLVEQLVSHPEAGLACADVGDDHIPRVQPWLGPIGEPMESGDDSGSLPQWELADYPHGTLMALAQPAGRSA